MVYNINKEAFTLKGVVHAMNEPKSIKPIYESPHQMGDISMFFKAVIICGFPCFGIASLIFGFFTAYFLIAVEGDVYSGVFYFILLLCLSLFLLILGWVFLMYFGTHYRFETDGLYVKYPLHSSWRVISWDQFQQVCIVQEEHWAAGQQQIDTAICCVMKGEKKNRYGRWKSHNPFKYRTVIYIAYTPELHEGIKERCPYEVCDLRDTYPYRIYRYNK